MEKDEQERSRRPSNPDNPKHFKAKTDDRAELDTRVYEVGSSLPIQEMKRSLEFLEFVERISKSDNTKRIVVIASGGRGKTVMSKRLMVEWALGRHLETFVMVVRLDMKLMEFDITLFENMLNQYPIFQRELNHRRMEFETDPHLRCRRFFLVGRKSASGGNMRKKRVFCISIVNT